MTVEEIIQAVAELPSFITEEDIQCYFKYANLIAPGRIVDLGTGWGKSMVALGLANKMNKIISCDPGNYPIYQGWAKDQTEYEYKIKQLIDQFGLKEVIQFVPTTAEDLIEYQSDPNLKVELVHIDNWVEMNQKDSTLLLKKYVDIVNQGGYLLIRNYGHADRQPFTDSVDRAMQGLKQIEQMGLITVFQK